MQLGWRTGSGSDESGWSDRAGARNASRDRWTTTNSRAHPPLIETCDGDWTHHFVASAVRFLANLHQLSDWGLLALRVGVGMSFWVHGMSKRAMWKMAPSSQMPASLLSTVRLLSIVEPLGAVAAFAGFLMQPAAVGFVIIMLGAIRLKAVQMH